MPRAYIYSYKGQKVYEKVFNITNHQGNTNQNYHLTLVRTSIIKKKKKGSQIFTKIWRKENPCAQLIEMQTGTATMETVWKVLKKLIRK